MLFIEVWYKYIQFEHFYGYSALAPIIYEISLFIINPSKRKSMIQQFNRRHNFG